MRFFIIVDGKSRVSAEQVWNILNLHCAREEFEVLPIPGSQFREGGWNAEQLIGKAQKEATRVLERYQDVSFCVVVFHTPRRISPKGTKVIPSDCAYVLYRDNKKAGIILNDKIGSVHRVASSPRLQPELTDALLEYTLIDLAHKY
jgi:hypothetical protein